MTSAIHDFSSQKSADSKIPRQTFFSRTVEAKEPLSSSSSLVKASTAKLLNQTDFQTEYMLYQYQRSPLYRALITHNVSRMLDHELPSTIIHNSFKRSQTEAIKQKMFIYYQTKHLHNTIKNEKFSFDETQKPIFTDNEFLNTSNEVARSELDMINQLISTQSTFV